MATGVTGAGGGTAPDAGIAPDGGTLAGGGVVADRGVVPDGGRTLPDGVFVVGSIDGSMEVGIGDGAAIVRVISDDAAAFSIARAALNSSAVW